MLSTTPIPRTLTLYMDMRADADAIFEHKRGRHSWT